MKVKKMSIYQLCADRLNAKGVKPFSARQWSLPLIQQTVYGKVNYPEVMEEIKLIMKEHEQSNI
jgi:hypothetical protein